MITSSSRTQRLQARNRRALVSAARRVFVRDGFERATIAAIAQEADLGFGTFYRYFPDKASALRAVVDEVAEDIDGVLLAGENAEPPLVALPRFSRRFVAMVARNRDVFLLMWQVGMRRQPRPAAGGDLPMRLGRALEDFVRRGVARGEFSAADVDLHARLLTGAHLALIPPPAWNDDDRVAAALIEFELRALGAAQAEVPGSDGEHDG